MNSNVILKVGVLIERGEKLLLIKEKRLTDDAYRWNIIKGTFEPRRDRSLISAAEREAKEEAGAEIKNLNIFNVFEVEKGETSLIQINFVANLKNKITVFERQSAQENVDEDIVEIKFFNKQALKKLRRADFINERAYLTVQDWITNHATSFRILD